MSSEAAAVFSTDFHSRAGICTNKSPGEINPDGSAPFLQCIAALDQGYSQAWAAIPARTAFSSTYAYVKFKKSLLEKLQLKYTVSPAWRILHVVARF